MGARPRQLLRWFLLLVWAARCSAMYWIKGEPGASCTEACPTLCLEDPVNYPNTSQEFAYMTEVLHEKGCKKRVEGGMRYDPSIDRLGNCGFHVTTTAPKGMKFCGVEPPPGTQRFCPCKGTSIAGTLSLNLQVACPEQGLETQRRSERQCAKAKDASLAEIGSWSPGRRALCCCTTGHGCVDKDKVLGATTLPSTGMALERAFADGVGVEMRHFALMPPPEQIDSGVGSPPGTQTLRWRYELKAESSVQLDHMHCGHVKEAARSVDWSAIFAQSVPTKEVPLPYNVDVNEVHCDDWQCSAWQWSDAGGMRELPADRAKWCCSVRGVGCGESHLWILFASVAAINVLAIAGIMWSWLPGAQPAGSPPGYSRMNTDDPDSDQK